ncbi:MAG: hypothetical protein PARBA_02499 [Parabacteroides sp.]
MNRLLYIVVFSLYIGYSFAQKTIFPYQNTTLDFEDRVVDLVSRMTLEEKVSQMGYKSPGIPRLNVPSYNWWSGCAHGVGRTKEIVTVYPQSIALAATFNPAELFVAAGQIADEARVLHHKAKREGRFGEQYYGLTMWDPNINIFRDPRWGRGHETYGEDPYLTSRMGLAFVKGLEGNDSKYLKTSACAKHYAVHSGPEYNRHTFNAEVSMYDLWDTYLPAFKEVVMNGNVSSVMCAYNRLEGMPCCGHNVLLKNILREEFKFDGYVVSDCGAIANFWNTHKTHKGKEDASIEALLAGTDLECGDEDGYSALINAVNKGLIDEKYIDESVKRLFMVRFRLGMFDPDSIVTYANIPEKVLNSPTHKEQALKLARESIVLLKNDGILPLKKDIGHIAILGPNADNSLTPLANYNGIPEKVITPLEGIRNKLPQAKIVYDDICYPVVNERDINKVLIDSIVAEAAKAEVIIFVGGLNSDLEGENGDAGKSDYDGFKDGDRTSIRLPMIQTKILKALYKTGKPVIFVLMTGSALTFPWEADNIPAIVNVWYGGQSTGDALADILFGDYNPNGKLPVTFYKSDEDLPLFENYSMENRTYRYFKEKPLYPFGYGLSYTTFKFDNLVLKKKEQSSCDMEISVDVTNTGSKDGAEVVQLYLSHLGAPNRTALRSLVGFQKVFLKKGEKQRVNFVLNQKQLRVVLDDGSYVLAPGKIKLTVGNGQPIGFDSISYLSRIIEL